MPNITVYSKSAAYRDRNEPFRFPINRAFCRPPFSRAGKSCALSLHAFSLACPACPLFYALVIGIDGDKKLWTTADTFRVYR
ncbi:MAG: hypothetical protein GY765_22920 [bacterium]|nr:hypothetical protein [bacterium]